ncbi:tetratricopeptide repeat protein [Tenacibaculum adriaticum]|uniref:Tetratricopeptide repeat protein n=1 Tax=Tenacibaculum adriaticum TaxID=413713 RepID=A0A5S5DVR9_9FLAO|nr:tetratricopeptide repeat protein [Tenacibaculum adriaticum]TYP99951.1 tetratricopeptide repeat protein [Tenacibaculum adriaticum]
MTFNLPLYLFVFLFSFITLQKKDKSNDSDFIIKILKDKPKDYFSLDSYLSKKGLSLKEAEDFYEQCNAVGYKIGEVYALNSLGKHYRNNSDYKTALKYHQKALAICKENNFIDPQILCLNLIGVIYRRQDDIRNALDYHQSALSLAKRIKNPTLENKKSISVSENSIGNIYITLRQYNLALQQFNKSLEFQEELNNKRGLAINFQNIGNAQEHLNLFDEALASYNKSLMYNKEINSTLGEIICKNSICSTLIKKGDYQQALKIIEEIYPIAVNLNDQYYVSQTLSNLGWARLKVEDYENAKNNLIEALEISEKYNVKHIQIEVPFRLAELFEKTNNSEKAYIFYKKGIEEEKKTLGQRNIVYVNNLIAKHDLQSKINEINNLENITKIKTLQLARNRNILIITLVSIALLSVALYSVYRQRLLKNDQRILLLEQQALQTQMNPHFIFNALNSIKLYIINNEQKNAVYYLNKFSKLIRNILDVSKVKEVSLREELNTMNLYMSIENIRFSNEIKYIERIHPYLNTDTIKLPPLVLQPFLENAIWHGLSSKEGEKEIILEAEKVSKNLIVISITDNGIGRDAALNIKKRKSLKRKSIGIDLTIERMKTFCNDFSGEFSLNYQDLIDEKGNSAGTKVSLQIPLY